MVLTWILYLKNSSSNQKNFKKLNLPSFFVLPKIQKKLTITKSPMAHKTFSQEQYLFKFYTLVVSYSILMEKHSPTATGTTTSVNSTNTIVNTTTKKCLSLNSSLLFILKQRTLSPLNLGTNLFFLKKLISYSAWSDPLFLKFF